MFTAIRLSGVIYEEGVAQLESYFVIVFLLKKLLKASRGTKDIWGGGGRDKKCSHKGTIFPLNVVVFCKYTYQRKLHAKVITNFHGTGILFQMQADV